MQKIGKKKLNDSTEVKRIHLENEMQFKSLQCAPIRFLKMLNWRFELDDIGMIEACWQDVPLWVSLNNDKDLVSSFDFYFDEKIFMCILNPRRSKVSVSTSHERRDDLIDFINKNGLKLDWSNLENEVEYLRKKYFELRDHVGKLKSRFQQ